MSALAIATVVAVLIIIIWLILRRSRHDPVEEQYTIARAKLDRARAYDGYQNHLLSKCASCIPGDKRTVITPDDQARLVSLREMSPALTQSVNDLGGALIRIYAHGMGPDGHHADTVERLMLVNSALDKLWLLQCEQDKRIMALKSFQFVYPRTQW